MELKVKTAGLSTCMNILLTCIKFAVYYFSGSMAILAEAWHSFTDIATSFLVFIAVKRASRVITGDTGERQETDGQAPGTEDRQPAQAPELVISLGIGLLLATVSVFLLRRFIYGTSQPVENALPSGLLFIVFSFGSYFIYRFETRIGREEGSLGLISDGLHAKADMIASLLTGFSLILYSLGLNLDRWVAGFIALFILLFALETIINVIRVRFRGESDHLFRHSSYSTLAMLFDKDSLEKGARTVRTFLENKLGKTRFMRFLYRALFILPVLILLAVYLSTAVFTVGVREQAVIERFGKPLSGIPVGSGLHLKIPWPVDRVRKVESEVVRELNIGNITDRGTMALLWTRKHGTEVPFLSGDNNYFYPYIVIHYRIKDIFHYLYKNRDPHGLADGEAYRIITIVFANKTFYDIATTERGILEQEVMKKLQEALDEGESGIELLAVNFKDIHPPISIADSFELVIAGYQEKRWTINEALGYKNKVLPEARGKAYQETESARGYITDRKDRAEGTGKRFLISLPSSPGEKEVTMSRIYLENVREGLKGKNTILLDPRAGEPDLWIDFEKGVPTTLSSTGGPYGK